MIYELESNRLEVFLTPAPAPAFPGHQIRTVESRNPDWYRDLCDQYQSNRTGRKGRFKKHGDTKIRRQHILSVLRRLANGEDFDSKYKEFLVDVAKNLKEQFEMEAIRCPRY
jgi:hypothetical protein